MEGIQDIYELSPTQQSMLFHTLSVENSALYFMQLNYDLRGELEIPAFRTAWEQISRRHPPLRASFHWEEVEKPLQVIHEAFPLPFETFDWRGVPKDEQVVRLEAHLVAEQERGFDFDDPPLFRLQLIRLSEQHTQFIWSFHHILFEGWSAALILDELFAIYRGLVGGERAVLPQRRPYRDYILWLQEQDHVQAERFWRQKLAGLTAPTSLTVGREAGPAMALKEDSQTATLLLEAKTSAALQNLARRQRLTLNTLCQGAWALLLSRYGSTSDVIFGNVVSGRSIPLEGAQTMVGLFIKALPFRTQIRPAAPLLEWLAELQREQAELLQYEHIDTRQIQSWSAIPHTNMLFESLLVFQNWLGDIRRPEITESLLIEQMDAYEDGSGYPLTLYIAPGERLSLVLSYDSGRFTAAEMTRLLGHYANVLSAVAARPEQRVAEVGLLGTAERREMLGEWNRTAVVLDESQGLVAQFEQLAEEKGTAVAFRCDGVTLTYAELERQSNQMAHYLLSQGVRRGDLVGLCLPRSLEAITAVLAIFKAGAAYLPLDPAYPQERLAFMATDAGLKIVVSRSDFAANLPGREVRVLALDQVDLTDRPVHRPAIYPGPDELAYVIYTSGSTGRPKGAALPHRQILNRLAWMWREYPFQDGEVGAQKTALSFVDSIWEIFGYLLQGVPTVIIPDEAITDPQLLVETLAREEVSRLWFVPSFLKVLLDAFPDLAHRLPKLTFWVTSGEAITHDLNRRFHQEMPQATLFNLYGTSEVWDVTWYVPEPAHDALTNVPIGRPIDNTDCYILDDNWLPAPVGVPGQLYVGGLGLGWGYLGRSGLTADKFIPHPFSSQPGARLYASGDLARYLPDGQIAFLGRRDHQVKIRGFRVEPGEIEVALRAHPDVKDAVVIDWKSRQGDVRLAAYLTAKTAGDKIDVDTLRAFLASKVPEHMIPAAFIFLDELPLTPSGKINRQALPDPLTAQPQREQQLLAPRNTLEHELAAIWRDLLGLEQISIDDNFFALGGHSLLATQVISRIRQKYEIGVSMANFFARPTIIGLAEIVKTIQLVSQVSPEDESLTAEEDYEYGEL